MRGVVVTSCVDKARTGVRVTSGRPRLVGCAMLGTGGGGITCGRPTLVALQSGWALSWCASSSRMGLVVLRLGLLLRVLGGVHVDGRSSTG